MKHRLFPVELRWTMACVILGTIAWTARHKRTPKTNFEVDNGRRESLIAGSGRSATRALMRGAGMMMMNSKRFIFFCVGQYDRWMDSTSRRTNTWSCCCAAAGNCNLREFTLVKRIWKCALWMKWGRTNQQIFTFGDKKNSAIERLVVQSTRVHDVAA